MEGCMEITEFSNKNGENMDSGCGNSFDFTPEGLRVLAVDDNAVCLKLLTALLEKYQYQVTSLGNKTEALEVLNQNADKFDIILTNVYVDEMEGFELLKLGRKLDIPVIMISADDSTAIIMKRIEHEAVDYLIKPVRSENVKTLWKHVYRKKHACPTPLLQYESNNEHGDEIRDGDRKEEEETRGSGELFIRTIEDLIVDEDASNNEEIRGGDNQGVTTANISKKSSGNGRKKNVLGGDENGGSDDDNNNNSGSVKRERIKWAKDLHEKFLDAIERLGGIDSAVPKKILELMGVPGLTREKVASHLQKHRKNIKKKFNIVDNSNHNCSNIHLISNNSNNNNYHLMSNNNNNNNNYYYQYRPSYLSGRTRPSSSLAALYDPRTILGSSNMSRGMMLGTNFYPPQQPCITSTSNWTTPLPSSVSYTPVLSPPMIAQQPPPQPPPTMTMNNIDRPYYMGSVSNLTVEQQYLQFPQDSSFDLRLQQLPQESIFDQNPSIIDPTSEISPLADMFSTPFSSRNDDY